MVYMKALDRGGLLACLTKLGRRLLQIYFAHVVVSIIIIFLAWWLVIDPSIHILSESLYERQFLDTPSWTTIGRILFLGLQPTDILPLYLKMMMLLPVFLMVCTLFGVAVGLGIVGTVYLATIVFLATGNHAGLGGEAFNPLCWQALFFIAASVGLLESCGKLPDLATSRMMRICTGLLVCGIAGKILLHFGKLGFWPMSNSAIDYRHWLFSKQDLGPLRLLSGGVLLLMLRVHGDRLVQAIKAAGLSRPLGVVARVGRNSLAVFSFGIVASACATLLQFSFGTSLLVQTIVVLTGVASTVTFGLVADHFSIRRPAAPAPTMPVPPSDLVSGYIPAADPVRSVEGS
jgi:hypothetical protein